MTLSAALFAFLLAGPPGPDVALPDLDGRVRTPTVVSAGHKLSAVVFVTVDCPISNQFSPEVNRLAAAYGSKGVEFFLVHVDPDVDAAKAKAHAREFGTKCAVLLDRRHALVQALKARKTPEAFVIGKKGQVLYRGRIDDRYPDLGILREPRTHDLKDALDQALAGQPVRVPKTEAVGCLIPLIGRAS